MNVVRPAACFPGLFAALLIAGAALAAAPPPPPVDVPSEIAQQIKTSLHKRFPEVDIKQIHPSPLPGIYEVLTDGQLLYTNASGTLAFVGTLIDTQTQEDLTTQRWSELNSVDFDSLPLDLAIKVVRGNGKQTLAVFADPLCPFCHELEQSLDEISNTTVYVFLYPLEGIHPGADAMAHKIWCTQDRTAAWSGWMSRQQPPPPAATCDTGPLQTIHTLGEQLQVNSTPTLIFKDGERLRGLPHKDRLQQMLSKAG
jgi:thiol:disulfide interchange protein DsbC